MKKKFLTLMLATVLALTTFASCSNKKDPNKLYIGAIGPLSGNYVQYGSAVRNGAKIAVDEINALEDNYIQIEFKAQDDEAESKKAKNAFNSLLKWGMQVSLVATTSGSCNELAPELSKLNMFGLTPAGSNDMITKNGKGNVFQMCFSDSSQGTAVAQYIKEDETLKNKKVGVFYQSDSVYSTSIYTTFIKEYGEANVVASDSFKESETLFATQVLKMKEAGVELLFLPIYYSQAKSIIIELYNKNFTPICFGVDGMDGIVSELGEEHKDKANGIYLLTPFSADDKDEMVVNFVNKYKAKYNEIPNQFAADAYDSIYAIYQACKKGEVKSTMATKEITDKLKAVFTSKDFVFNGTTGKGVQWTSEGAVSKSPKAVRILNGVYVSPENYIA